MIEITSKKPFFYAILAALLYGISTPFSKMLLKELPPTFLASLLYLGAGIGMSMLSLIRRTKGKQTKEAGMTKKDLPYILGMIFLDIVAPIFLMLGLTTTSAASVSLLNNLEIVATGLIALFFFKEPVGKKMWLAIALITISGVLLSVDFKEQFIFSTGSGFVVLACLAWGFENNCTRMLSLKDPLQIVKIKGFGSGVGALVVGFVIGEIRGQILYILATLALGFVAYGLSIFFYIRAQRELGAARTSSFYALAPFLGVLVSWILFREGLTLQFLLALGIMILGTGVIILENHHHSHVHEPLTHTHMHNHQDGHHTHFHQEGYKGEHSHLHTHEQVEHDHTHLPDMHHHHSHK